MSDREAFEAMMRDTFGDAVSLHNDGVMYTDGFVGAVHIGWLKGSLAEAERFKRELEMQAAQAPQPVVPEGYALVTLNDLKTLQFYLEPYDDIKPRDWVTDRRNLRIAHQLLQALLSAGKGGEPT